MYVFILYSVLCTLYSTRKVVYIGGYTSLNTTIKVIDTHTYICSTPGLVKHTYKLPYLVSPFIDSRHVDVINKDSHLLASWWTISAANSLVNVALNGSLYQGSKSIRHFNNIVMHHI